MLGTNVGNYTVTAKIGHGGMGVVYLAHHAMLGRRAAVKVLLPALSNHRDTVARFFNEARAATAIQHPSIVEIFDFGHLPDGSAYIVMEFLDGESLTARCHRLGRLEPGRALALVRQIAGALAAAHDRGIVHRDLKPDNVFVIADPEVPGGERIKILDFGIAKLAGDVDASRTQTGTVLGTPTYIAPEQCRSSGHVDARADLYALGCVFYELVCGRPPFVVEGAAEVIAHHLYFEPQPPRSHEPSIPEAVDRLILWLLRKQPEARPQNARELVDAIDRIGQGPAGAAVPPAPSARRSFTALPAQSTTLSAAAGATAVRAIPARRRWLIAAVAVGTVAAGLVVYLAATAGRGRPAPSAQIAPAASPGPVATASSAPPPPPPPRAPPATGSAAAVVDVPAAPQASPPATAAAPEPVQAAKPHEQPAQVRLAIDSDPGGAAVTVGGKRIGATPFDERVVAGAGRRVYTVAKDGYEPATVTLDTGHDGSQRVALKKRPASKATPQGGLGDKGINPFDH